MQFVNLTTRAVYTTFSGNLNPGQVSGDGGPKRRKLEEALSEIIKVCGNSLGIRLNAREAELLNRLMNLDEKGGGFDKSKLPEDVRNDPTGAKRNAQAIKEAQQNEMDARAQVNTEAARREAEINGETDPNARKPVGPATLEGEKVEPEKLKSGFEQIMEENAKIAAGEGEQPEKDVNEILDPIGTHAKKEGEEVPEPGVETSEDQEARVPGGEPVSVPQADHLEDDGTKSADALEPVPQAPEKGSEMDRQAAEVAEQLSTMGPTDAKGKKNKVKKAK